MGAGGGGGGTVVVSCLVLPWSRVLAAGVCGSVVHEPGPLCVCVCVCGVVLQLCEFCPVPVSKPGRKTDKIRPYTNFRISDVAGAVLYGTLRLRQAACYGYFYYFFTDTVSVKLLMFHS
jgi:hypothetical protein